VYSTATGLHAVLVVHADRGDFVLDNLTEEVRLAEAAPYLWLSMQTGPNLLAWTGVRLARAPAREAVPAPFQTSAPQPAPGEHEFAPTPLLTATALSAPEGAGAAAYAEIAPLAGGPAPDAARQLKSMKPAPLDKAVTLADAVRLRAMLGKAHAAT
ncbi:MAG: transglutaminase-like cysteine peptidase, partial [Hyphomonadaceae bacterium]